MPLEDVRAGAVASSRALLPAVTLLAVSDLEPRMSEEPSQQDQAQPSRTRLSPAVT